MREFLENAIARLRRPVSVIFPQAPGTEPQVVVTEETKADEVTQ